MTAVSCKMRVTSWANWPKSQSWSTAELRLAKRFDRDKHEDQVTGLQLPWCGYWNCWTQLEISYCTGSFWGVTLNGTATLWVPLGRRALPTASEGLSAIASPCVEFQGWGGGQVQEFGNKEAPWHQQQGGSQDQVVHPWEGGNVWRGECCKIKMHKMCFTHNSLRSGFLPGKGNGLSDAELQKSLSSCCLLVVWSSTTLLEVVSTSLRGAYQPGSLPVHFAWCNPALLEFSIFICWTCWRVAHA